MTTRTLLLTLALALGVTSPAAAHRPIATRGLVDVALVCEGSPCDEVASGGQRYVVAGYGDRYTIALTNRSGGWVEAVVAVDGRSVTDGRRVGTQSRGYLLAPYQRVELEGWRIDTREVAAFRFTSVGDSYAGRIGSGADAGQIRVDVYNERGRPEVWVPAPSPWTTERDDRPSRSSAEKAAPSSVWRDGGQDLGTQYGESRWQPVEQRDFERASSYPAQSVTLRYDDARGLAARGILPGHRWPERWVDDRRDDRWVPPPPVRIDD